MITFLAGMIGIITAINAGSLALFIIATIVAGAGQGIAISAATRGLLHGSTLADRALIFSAIYLLCYSGATFPILISGQLSNTFSLPQIAFGYGVLALVVTLFTVLGARNPHTDATGNSTCDSSSTLDDAVAAFNPTERRAGEDDHPRSTVRTRGGRAVLPSRGSSSPFGSW
jgi:hypothetical protein